MATVCRLPIRYLNPAWLEHLVRRTAAFGNINPKCMTDVSELMAHFTREQGMLELSSPGGERASLDQLPVLCREAGWSCEDEDGKSSVVRWASGTIKATSRIDGVRLALELGEPRENRNLKATYQRMVVWNSDLGTAKLGLTRDGAVKLICDAPRLDTAGFAEMKSLVESKVEPITSDLKLTRAI
jgi:hypothetical protein